MYLDIICIFMDVYSFTPFQLEKQVKYGPIIKEGAKVFGWHGYRLPVSLLSPKGEVFPVSCFYHHTPQIIMLVSSQVDGREGVTAFLYLAQYHHVRSIGSIPTFSGPSEGSENYWPISMSFIITITITKWKAYSLDSSNVNKNIQYYWYEPCALYLLFSFNS